MSRLVKRGAIARFSDSFNPVLSLLFPVAVKKLSVYNTEHSEKSESYAQSNFVFANPELRVKFFVYAVVTDGHITRKIFTVKYTGNHFIFICPVEGQNCHVTYHRDGWILERLSPRGPVFRKTKYSALDDYRGDAPTFGAFLNIDKPDTWGSIPRRTEAKEVIIDLQPCIGKTNVVSVHAPLLIPGDLEPVNFYHNNFNVLKCEVFKETNPWFAMIGYYRA